MVPWYGYLYMAVLGLLVFAGIIEELKKPGGKLYALGTFMSLLILLAFVLGSFITEIGETMGLFSIPLLLIALVYDFYLSSLNLIIGSKHFGEPLEEVKSRMDLMTASIIVAPGYLAGITVIYRAVIGN
ncbi:MAG: hypothetical protein ACI9N9_001266 [Enterobacterales bacterium]|jgi:hypothetical protein